MGALIKRIETDFPCLFERIGYSALETLLEHKIDYYLKPTLLHWLSKENSAPLHDIERALKIENNGQRPRLLFDEQFKKITETSKLENQEALLNEIAIGARLYTNGLNVRFRNVVESGSDLIWTTASGRKIHIEIASVQYTEKERSRLNQENNKNRVEREEALKSGQRSAMTFQCISPFAGIPLEKQVERIRTIKRGKNQVSNGDAGVLIVPWTLNWFKSFFEPVAFDRWMAQSGFIYHAYYGKKNGKLLTMDITVDMLANEDIARFGIKKTINNGRFLKNSKFSTAIFIPVTCHDGVFFRNYESLQPLKKDEILLLVGATDSGQSPSRWFDEHKPDYNVVPKIEAPLF